MTDNVPQRVIDRALTRYNVDGNGCWVWTMATSSGYGIIGWSERGVREQDYTHRVVYRALVGPIPSGYELDHLCMNPPCCNPSHLEAVTPRLNKLRSGGFSGVNARKTHCPEGHPYAGDNLRIRSQKGYPSRYCATCRREQVRRQYDKVRSPKVPRTHCARGHALPPVEQMVRGRCRECRRFRDAAKRT